MLVFVTKLPQVKQTLQHYKELQDIIAMLGLEKLSEEVYGRLRWFDEYKTHLFIGANYDHYVNIMWDNILLKNVTFRIF